MPDWLLFALLGAVGGVCFQIYRSQQRADERGQKFTFVGLIANGIVASFVSGIAGTYLQVHWPAFAHGIAGALGFASFPLLQWLERNGGRLLSRRMGLSEPAPDRQEKPMVSISDTQYLKLKEIAEQARRYINPKTQPDKDDDVAPK